MEIRNFTSAASVIVSASTSAANTTAPAQPYDTLVVSNNTDAGLWFSYGPGSVAVPSADTFTAARYVSPQTVQAFAAPGPNENVSLILTTGTGSPVLAFGSGS